MIGTHRECDDISGDPSMPVSADGAGERGIAGDARCLPNAAAVEAGDLLDRPDRGGLTVASDRLLEGIGCGCHARDCSQLIPGCIRPCDSQNPYLAGVLRRSSSDCVSVDRMDGRTHGIPSFIAMKSKIENLVGLIKAGQIGTARPWQGADVVITRKAPAPSTDSFYPDPRYV